MELKKKTIIWEDNNEPPKDYIWIKSDGKAYEFDYNDRKWKESTSINVNNNGSDDGGGGESDGGSQEELDFINQAVNIIKNSINSSFISINGYNDNIKDEEPPELQKVGDENNADYVFIITAPNYDTDDADDVNYIALFLTEDEFNIVCNMIIASAKSYLKGYIKYNDGNNYDYYDKSSRKYLNFNFVFLLVNDYEETLMLDDVDVNYLGGMEIDNNGYIKIYVPYTEVNNNFLFKIDNDTSITEFTKNVSIDAEHPVEVNGVNYYPIVYGGGQIVG